MSQSVPQRNEEPCSSCGLPLDVEGSPLLALVKCPHCHSEVRVRTRFGSYELLDVLGEGGSSRVFRARLEQGNENDQPLPEVALKVLEKTQRDFQENLLLLRKEASFAAMIQHPRMVKVLALTEEEEGAHLAMEIMDGGSLHDRIVSGEKLDEQWILETGFEILKALAAAYEKGIIHRDLKPANILFAASGGAKLADFGLARSVVSSRGVELESVVEEHLMATPDYVAPEIMTGGAGDFRSDLYGLGGTLYHAFTGEPPYKTEGKSLEDLIRLKQQRMKLSFIKWNLLPETAMLINRMLEPDPKGRFVSYKEMENSFRTALEKLDRSKKTPSLAANPLFGVMNIFRRSKKSASARS